MSWDWDLLGSAGSGIHCTRDLLQLGLMGAGWGSGTGICWGREMQVWDPLDPGSAEAGISGCWGDPELGSGICWIWDLPELGSAAPGICWGWDQWLLG